jgi:hypothetical protein
MAGRLAFYGALAIIGTITRPIKNGFGLFLMKTVRQIAGRFFY